MLERYLDLCRTLLTRPTAPFHERFISEAVTEFCRQRPALQLDRDAFGNLQIEYDGRKKKNAAPYLVVTAHMDHPAFAFVETVARRRSRFETLGGLEAAQLPGAAVRLYDIQQEATQAPVPGRIAAVHSLALRRTQVEVEAPTAGPGYFAVLDLPPLRRRGPRLYSGACDDLAGLCVGLLFIDELMRQRRPVRAGVLVTRAEEVGFGGMLAAVRQGRLDRQACYINIECSSAKAGAPLGQGPVIRLGDRLWVFDPHISAGLEACAADLKKADPAFCYQRKLMDGGACEATVLMQAGLSTGAVALPLHNYHNRGARGPAAEAIDLDDAVNLVRLLVHTATARGGLEGARRRAGRRLDDHLAGRYRAHKQRLLRTEKGDYGR